MFEVTVEDTFAAGHYLRNYKGKCENPHGHNYKIRVTLAGHDLDKAGLLLDFKDLRVVMKHVIDRLDHQMMGDIAPFADDKSLRRGASPSIFTTRLTSNLTARRRRAMRKAPPCRRTRLTRLLFGHFRPQAAFRCRLPRYSNRSRASRRMWDCPASLCGSPDATSAAPGATANTPSPVARAWRSKRSSIGWSNSAAAGWWKSPAASLCSRKKKSSR